MAVIVADEIDLQGHERRERRRGVFRFLSKREAQAFPRQTLVLASARSRHIQPGIPEAGSGRNLSLYYREEAGHVHPKCFSAQAADAQRVTATAPSAHHRHIPSRSSM